MATIILASSSPRRKNLLTQVKIPFRAIHPNINENNYKASFNKYSKTGMKKRVEYIASMKISAILPQLSEKSCPWVVGMDTLIEIDGCILGKPSCKEEAEKMLTILSGKTHDVYTGIAILHPGNKILKDSCLTRVKFKRMDKDEIAFYLDTDEWNGVSGAYRIQERGSFFVQSIKGSYSNVVGLPLSLFYGMLKQCNFPFSKG